MEISKKYDVLVVGELNVDILLNSIDSFPEIGKEKLAGSMDIVLGSSSAIFASNISRLGKKVGFLGMIGDDIYGSIVLSSLEQSGVDTSPIIRSQQYSTGATVILNYEEDRANVTFPGAMEYLTGKEISMDLLAQAKHLHFSSYFLQPGLRDDLGSLFKKAKQLGLSTSLDPQWDPKEEWNFDYRTLLPYVDVFLPNLVEFLNTTGESSLETAIDKVKEWANWLVIKDGNRGSVGWTNDRMYNAQPFLNQDVVDAIGAGDSFNAGFIFKYTEGFSIETCLEFGNLMGAVSTTEAGGTGAFRDFSNIVKIASEKFNYQVNDLTREI